MEPLALLIFWLSLAGLVGALAHRRGRMGFGWFMLAVMLSPLLIGLLLIILPDASARARAAAAETPSDSTHTRCPECRELVRRDARKCKHCSTTLHPGA